MAKFKNLIGKKFNKLTVIARAEDHIEPSGRKRIMWVCQCECGNIKIIPSSRLPKTLSCGCAIIEANKRRIKHKKEKSVKEKPPKNLYNLSGEYGIGYTAKGEEFWFDLEDYDLIKNYLWKMNEHGYIVHGTLRTTIQMHRLIMKVTDPKQIIDHIFSKRFDNRKSQLRIVNSAENAYNHKKSIKNTSGVTGVYWNKRQQKWRAAIKFQGKEQHLGYYLNFEDAVIARKKAEQKYFGEFAYKGE